jgi:nicotinate-nucleotide adenylyltransferase
MTLLGVKRVAIYGGSFNPIHRGHLAVAQCAVEQGAADEVWLMVSPQNPLKAADGLMDEQVRLLLAQRATRNLPAVRVSDFEFHLPRPSYTWRTLSALQQHYPDCRFTLLVGSDNWALFPRWAHHEELLAQYGLLVYPRPGYPINAATLPSEVTLLDAPLFPHSSTEIRERLAAGEDVGEWVPSSVVEYFRGKEPG